MKSREEELDRLIAIAREIRAEFEKINLLMEAINKRLAGA